MAKKRRKNLSLHEKHWGLEPQYDPDKEDSDFLLPVFNWYNAMASDADLKKWFLAWMKENSYSTEDIAFAKRVKKVYRAGSLARMSSRGFPLSDIDIRDLKFAVRRAVDDGRAAAETAKASNKKTVQDYLTERINAILTDIEPVIDDIIATGKTPKTFNLKRDVLSQEGFKAIHAKRIAAEYEPLIEEMKAASVTKGANFDADLREAWDWLPLKQLKAATKQIERLVNECNTWAGFNKTKRAPRKAKAKPSVEKQLALFKFKDKDAKWKIQSIDPRKILGADLLFTFNTKYRQLMMYEASGPDGLTIHRGSVKGWDPKKSFVWKIRKPEEVLPVVTGKGKRAITNTLKTLSTKPSKVRGAVNVNTILLKVIK